MSYIRTKNGIYEVIENELGKLIKIDGGFILLDDICDYVIDRADTIEELCDEFVIVNGKLHQTTKAFNKIKEYFNPYDIFYGAVWCEWGLKYVAKLDDNGKLVLI